MTLAEDVDLKVFAERTEGFSGADLQGFLYNAHLEAIHGAVNIESFKEQQKRNEEVKQKDEDRSDFVLVRTTANDSGKSLAPPLTLAEKGQISQRVCNLITPHLRKLLIPLVVSSYRSSRKA